MADSTVLLEVIVEGKNIKIVQKQVEDLGASIDKSAKTTDKDSKAKKKNKKATDDLAAGQKNFNKGQKGVAGATANGTKAFSKQRQAIGGSSGLVGAYATLAANIFAATAAFGALQRAAQFEKLLQGFEAIAATTGRTSSIIVQSLKDITDGALSTEQAASSAAAGINAGFSTSEIERLAGVAKNAAVALGRNLPDAIDRLVRGTAKIEPEILDELGIFVRLDDAVQKYAISLGKSVSALNQTERRAAFLNETLEQGELKFGILEGVVTPDKYTKLAASFDDLTKTVLKFFSAIGSPVISLLAKNTGFLLSTLLLFGSSIASQVFPVIKNLGLKFMEAADRSKAAADKILEARENSQAATNKAVGDIQPLGEAKALNAVKQKALAGEIIQTKELEKAENSIAGSIAQKTGKVRKGIKARAGLTAEARAELKVEIQNLKTLREQLDTVRALKKADEERAQATLNAAKADRRGEREGKVGGALGDIQAGGAIGGFGTALSGLREFKAESGDINAEIIENVTPGIQAFEKNLSKLPGRLGRISFDSTKLIGRLGKLGTGLRIGGTAVRLFGAAFVNALPFIGKIIFVLSLLVQGLRAVFKFVFPVNKGLETLEKVSDGLAEKTRILNKTQENYVRVLRRQKIETALQAAGGKELGSSLALITTEQMALIDAQVESAAAARLFREQTSQANGILIEISDGFSDAVTEQRKFENALGSSATKMEKFQRLIQNVVRPVLNVFSTNFRLLKESILSILPTLDQLGSVTSFVFSGIKSAIGSLVDTLTGPYKAAWNLLSGLFPNATAAAEEFVTDGVEKTKAGLLTLGQTASEAAQEFVAPYVIALRVTEGLNAGIQALADTTEEAARTNTVLAAGIKRDFKDRGIIGTFKDLIASGMSVADAMTQIQVRVDRVQGAIGKLDANIKGIETSFSTLTEESSKFLTKFKNKNPLADLNDAAVNASTTLASLGENLKNAGQDTERVNSLIKESGVDFKRLGISIEDVTKNGAEALKPLLDSLTTYKDAVTTAKDETERLKNEISNLKINFDADKAFTEFKAKLLGFSKSGTFEIAVEDQLEIKLGDIAKERKFLEDKQQLEIDQIKQKYAVILAELMVADALTGSAIALSKAAEVLADPSKATTTATTSAIATTATGGPTGGTADPAKPVDPQEQLRADIAAKVTSVEGAQTAAIESVELKTQEAINRLGEKEIGLFASAITNAVTAAAAGETTGDRIESLVNAGGFKQIADSADKLRTKIRALRESKSITEDEMNNLLSGVDTEEFKATIEATKQVLSPMLEDLKALGPEGALVASIGEGLFTVSESFVTFADKQSTTADKIKAVGNIIASIGAIANAASQQRIAGIDKEISAEKKRDGKSKESLAKIAQLEKKKEGLERKAFDRNKKMQMAMVVMNAAASIAGILANETGKMGVLAVPLAFAVGGLALAQLAIIAGTSYQGGGGGGAAQSAPSTITAGQRSNTVDLATSQSSGGELGYLRGESGTGGSGNFRSAFMGARYRAMGGNAGYIVGEQGPELFVPETPGNIVPNEDINNAPAQNVNFSIQALDASGVESILTEQRGNIIGMLREAANSYGDSFLEDVNVGVYTPEAQGAGKA